mmetsp:Transcript_47420/g.55404  ORF Transcript_47420/g.55404 Transcript_47420/m.55404 type:complete len:89 (+) Transcript_47420:364-630(+)
MIIHQFSQWISDCHQSDTKVPGMLELFEKGICLVDGVAEDAFYLNNEYSLLMLLIQSLISAVKSGSQRKSSQLPSKIITNTPVVVNFP